MPADAARRSSTDHQLVAGYDGLVARLTGHDDKQIVFSLTHRQPLT